MILRPVRPQSPCGPPTTNRPVGLMWYFVFFVRSSAGTVAGTTRENRCQRRGMRVVFSGLQPQPRRTVDRMELSRHPALLGMASDFPAAIAMAQEHLRQG